MNILGADDKAKTMENIHDIFELAFSEANSEKMFGLLDREDLSKALVKAQVNFGFIYEAIQIVKKFVNPRMRAYSLAEIASGLLKVESREEAADTMDDALAAAKQIRCYECWRGVIDDIRRRYADVMLEYEKKWS